MVTPCKKFKITSNVLKKNYTQFILRNKIERRHQNLDNLNL